jgi:hypothetical protein
MLRKERDHFATVKVVSNKKRENIDPKLAKVLKTIAFQQSFSFFSFCSLQLSVLKFLLFSFLYPLTFVATFL